jgi:hypothetical protein
MDPLDLCGYWARKNNSCLRGAVAQKFQDSRRTVSGMMSRVFRLRRWLGNDRQKPCDSIFWRGLETASLANGESDY